MVNPLACLMIRVRRRTLNGGLLLYKDARWLLYAWLAAVAAAPGAWLLWASHVSPWRMGLFVIAGLIGYFLLKRLSHGAIRLDQGRGQIEVFKDDTYEIPEQAYLIDSIERIELDWQGRRRGRNASVYVVLCLKGKAEGQEIPLAFDEREAESVARILARFAKVEAFDWEGDQIWPEVEEEDGTQDEEEDNEE